MRITHRISLALVISLALNLLLAGLIAAHFFTRMQHPGPGGRLERFDREAASLALSEPYRPVVADIWRSHHKSMRPDMRGMFKMRRKMREILLADPFDRAAYDAAQAEIHGHMAETRAAITRITGDIAEALPAEERRRYFEAGFPRGPRHGRPGHGPRPGN